VRRRVEPYDAREIYPKLDLARHFVHVLSARTTRTDGVHLHGVCRDDDARAHGERLTHGGASVAL
jgi:hypothetical protein